MVPEKFSSHQDSHTPWIILARTPDTQVSILGPTSLTSNSRIAARTACTMAAEHAYVVGVEELRDDSAAMPRVRVKEVAQRVDVVPSVDARVGHVLEGGVGGEEAHHCVGLER